MASSFHRAGLFALLLGAVPMRAELMEEFLLPTSDSESPPTKPEETIYRQNDRDDHGFNRSLTAISTPTLSVYHAGKPAHRRAAIILCPGGGYDHLAIDPAGHGLARFFQSEGITAVVLKYRLPHAPLIDGAVPLPQQDALAAVRYVRDHASEWNLDPHRIGILGTSSGGHVAGSAALFGSATDGSRPDFAALLSPVITLSGQYAHAGSRSQLLGEAPAPGQTAAFSLEQNVHAGLPPFFLVHARDDKVVPYQNSEMMAAALRRDQVPVELLLVPAGGHSYAITPSPTADVWKKHFLLWLDALP